MNAEMPLGIRVLQVLVRSDRACAPLASVEESPVLAHLANLANFEANSTELNELIRIHRRHYAGKVGVSFCRATPGKWRTFA
jgi:hypothetical protein